MARETPEPSSYQWIDDAETLMEAACITAIAGARPDDVLHAFDADTSVTLSGFDAYGGDEPYPASVSVRVGSHGVLAVEANGYQGSRDEVLERLSLLGPAASIFWNVNDDNAFSCARDGRVVATVDMYDAEDPDGVDLPSELMDLFASAGDGTEVSLWATGLAMVQAFTGVTVSEESVTESAPVHPVAGS